LYFTQRSFLSVGSAWSITWRACTGCCSMPLHRSVPTLRPIVFFRPI